ncbi:MAG: translation elongation factor Ts [Ignavibacteria bacterium RBG_13_36_8]|nr:MAG: translation elongation factor Ts [Ignavibacteria bacterium RBG_13_36_8]
MAISATQVKELRDKTGAGMMDCKQALTEANGDFQKAIEILRKKGASVAAKRAEKSATEGLISTLVSSDHKLGIILEVNCETDFVAKSDDFVNFSKLLIEAIDKNQPKNIDELLKLTRDSKKIENELSAVIGKIGEKIEISRFKIEKTENGVIVDYVHHGSKLGVLIKADSVNGDNSEEFAVMLKDIAMQVAAMKPLCIYREEVPKDIVEKEIEIYLELAKKEGKPELVREKIAQGKLNKYYQENCLFEQTFVKDNSKTVGNLFKEFNTKNSAQAKLVIFHRFHVSDENK